jgi:hypothetical protein
MNWKAISEKRMWCEIVFENTGSADGIAMFHQLQKDGLKPGVDFDWKYMPMGSVSATDHIKGKAVILMFREQAMATFYTLKWQR